MVDSVIWLALLASDLIFLGIGLGAIVQVIWEVGKLVVNDAARHQAPALTWTNLAGVALGVAVMYFTAFMVTF